MERSGVFVSYARVDGEEPARKLTQDLTAAGVDVWMDRTEMDGGRDWWQQIVAAIDEREFLVLVMTPGFLASETSAREWRYARRQGINVFPTKASPDLDFDAMPRWMQAKHFYTFPNEWDEFLKDLRTAPEVDRVPFMAPALPRGYVERQDELAALRSLFLDKRGDGVATTSSLQGFGGYGKTTLATGLCHDDDMLCAFDDGVLWATLGQDDNRVRRELDRLHEALTGRRCQATELEDAAREVADRLADKRMIVVIDDVWKRADLRWFLLDGDTCARLVTTRQFDVAQEAATAQGGRIDVNEMTSGEAVGLLTARLEVHPEDLSPFTALVARLGEWPLLVELARGALHDRIDRGAPVDRALRYVDEALARHGLVAFDRTDSGQRNDAVTASTDMSLALLDQERADRWAELAVFPEDTMIPLRTLGHYWGLDDHDTEELAERLADLSLLRLDLGTDEVAIHDILLGVAQKRVEDVAGLHHRLVSAWGDLRMLPADDHYAWQWIGHHLVGARRDATLRDLLLDFAWISSKIKVAGVDSVEADCDRLTGDDELRLIGGAVRLSAHVIIRDPDQLPSQLCGRLSPGLGTGVGQLLTTIDESTNHPWLRPETQSLVPPGGPLLRTLTGHNDQVRAVAVTPDGTRIVSASDDGTLKVWDLDTGDELRTITGHDDGVKGVAVTPDGTRIVSRSLEVKVWDLHTGDEVSTLTGGGGPIAVTPDGTRIVSASIDDAVMVQFLHTDLELRTITSHDRLVRGVAVTPDGIRAVSASDDGTLKVWDLDTGDERRTLTGHTGPVNAVAVTPDGTRIVSASYDRTLKVWDLDTGNELRTLTGHQDNVTGVAVTPDGTRIVSASYDTTLKVWDLDTGDELRAFRGHTMFVWDVAITPDSTRAVSASWDRTLKVWDLDMADEARARLGHTNMVNGLATTPERSRVISASGDQTLKVWDAETGEELRTLTGHTDPVLDVAVAPDGPRAVSASWDRTLRIWDLDTGDELRILSGHTGGVRGVEVTPDGTRIVSASEDQTLKVWDLETGEELRTLTGHTDPVLDVAVALDGTRIVSASEDRTLKVWDLDTGDELRTLTGHTGPVLDVAVATDGTRIVSASEDRTLKVWDLDTGDELRTLTGHAGRVGGVAVTPDSTRIVSASDDGTLRVWDLDTGDLAATFIADFSLSACTTRDDHRYFAGGVDGRLHVLRFVQRPGGDF